MSTVVFMCASGVGWYTPRMVTGHTGVSGGVEAAAGDGGAGAAEPVGYIIAILYLMCSLPSVTLARSLCLSMHTLFALPKEGHTRTHNVRTNYR